jgi:hypothetical protein
MQMPDVKEATCSVDGLTNSVLNLRTLLRFLEPLRKSEGIEKYQEVIVRLRVSQKHLRVLIIVILENMNPHLVRLQNNSSDDLTTFFTSLARAEKTLAEVSDVLSEYDRENLRKTSPQESASARAVREFREGRYKPRPPILS